MGMMKLSTQRSQTTVFIRQKQIRLDFNSLNLPKIWALIPNELKCTKSLNVFKENVKDLTFDKCPCNICRGYIKGIAYIN